MEIQLEEGEINVGPDIDPYVPLVRPKINFETSAAPTPIITENETILIDKENENNSNVIVGSDLDTEDEDTFAKKLKLTLPENNKKYSVWNKDPNEDLTDYLKQVDVLDEQEMLRKKLFERSVENYSVPDFQKSHSSNVQPTFRRKRKHRNRNKIKDFKYDNSDDIPLSFLESMYSKNYKNKIIRDIESLIVDESSTFEEVADDLAKKLKESNKQLILKIVVVLGKKKAFQFFEKTRVIEKLGGMLINNGSRKRTSGGVFIFLIRNDKDLTEGQLNAIFDKEIEKKRSQRALSKQRRRKKSRLLNKKEKKDILTVLNNPPPSPNLPELPDRKDLVVEMDSCDQNNKDTNEIIQETINRKDLVVEMDSCDQNNKDTNEISQEKIESKPQECFMKTDL